MGVLDDLVVVLTVSSSLGVCFQSGGHSFLQGKILSFGFRILCLWVFGFQVVWLCFGLL